MKTERLIAHVRQLDGEEQPLQTHLERAGAVASRAASKLGLGLAGELLGLLHDLGKHSQEFQDYLRTATGTLDPDGDEEPSVASRKGKVDHSTAGAQLVWKELSGCGPIGQIVGQALSICIASHHSGLIDCLTTGTGEGTRDDFTRRMAKEDRRTHLQESLGRLDAPIQQRIVSLLHDPALIDPIRVLLFEIGAASPEKSNRSRVAQFEIGLLVRFLFSCLIAGDHQNTADFERPHAARERQEGRFVPWQILVDRIEAHLATFQLRHRIDGVRQEVSRHCLEAASRSPGLFTLTVPTGGGKTLASLRFALHHARLHKLDRVLYIVPFTTIIDQNAQVARKILEPDDRPQDEGRVVLEHHSNLEPLRQGWKNRVLTEDWDAPVVYTTSVQFLEALFGAGTRGARRMNQLARSVIIFDEIQSLPVKCVHLFNNAINFLAGHCGSTVVLCTATQPLLDDVDQKNGAAKLTPSSEIIPDVREVFAQLRRVEVKDQRRPGGWKPEEIASLAQAESARAGSCLVVVNTKKAARAVFEKLRRSARPLYHLSTSMCPAHRKESLKAVREHLENGREILCVSTQLIEAGVDLDFGSVIRFAAGLDSIAQAAGRCNRNGARPQGFVHVVNPADESLSALRDIEIGRQKAERVLDDFREDPARFDHDLLCPKAMQWFYKNYFFDRQKEMVYPISRDAIGRDDNLLNLLSDNRFATEDFRRCNKGTSPEIYFRQSFMAANRAFQTIDAPTQGVVIPYGKEGQAVVAALCAAPEPERQFQLLHEAQQFTVNVFPHEFQRLVEGGALREAQPQTEIYCLNEHYYSKDFGLSTEPVSEGEFLYVE
jgi:CRISPR-associated endonuclease/helicase Cas3